MPQDIEVDTTRFERKIAFIAQQADALAEVRVSGKPRDYWFVPEYGSKRGKRPWPNPGPRTVAAGAGRVFSSQAPHGYVFRFGGKIAAALRQRYKDIVRRKKAAPSHAELVSAANAEAERAVLAIKGAAPIGKGRGAGALVRSIELRRAK
jgi:hypothetical protein